MQFEISYDLKQPLKFLSALEKRLSRKRDILRKFAQIVTWNVREYIQEGKTPEGEIAPTSEWVARLEGKGHTTGLVWTEALLRSITYVLGSDQAYVGSPLPYAERVRRGGKRTFKRKVFYSFGEERWIPGGIVYEDGIRSGTVGSVDIGGGRQKGHWAEYDIETEERNYLVVTQQDADDVMEWLWRGVTGEG